MEVVGSKGNLVAERLKYLDMVEGRQRARILVRCYDTGVEQQDALCCLALFGRVRIDGRIAMGRQHMGPLLSEFLLIHYLIALYIRRDIGAGRDAFEVSYLGQRLVINSIAG